MNDIPLIKPVEQTITTMDGEEITIRIGRLPATEGRRFVALFPVSALPKVGDYAVNEECMGLLMRYVEVVKADGYSIRLTTKALIDNHIPDWEALAKCEKAAMEHNTSFFRDGRPLVSCEPLIQRTLRWVIKTLTPSLGQLLKNAAPPSKS